MKQDIDLTNFTAGEVSPAFYGRFDHEKYYSACQTMRNFVVMPQGGITARPGTMYVATPPDQVNGETLIPFIFSTTQAYVIGFADATASVYADDAVVTSGGAPVTFSTPYAAADTNALWYTQSFDVIYLTHEAYPPQQLQRLSATSFQVVPVVFKDGPYEDQNATATTVTPSGTSGAITLTFSSTTGINSGAGFGADDIGRFVRIRLVGIWAWCIITAITSTTVVSATVQPKVDNGAFGMLDGAPWQPHTDYPAGYVCTDGAGNYFKANVAGTSGDSAPSWTTTINTAITDNTVTWYVWQSGLPAATAAWRLSIWCTRNGYPSVCGFWQNRLVLLGSKEAPNAVQGSVTGDFSNFAPSQSDGTVVDSNAFLWNITDSEANSITWVSAAGSAQAMQLGIGTTGGEEIIQASSTAAALTANNVQAYQETAVGSAPMRPARINKSVLFVSRNGRNLFEWTFSWQVNGYLAPDLAVIAEHITRPEPADPDAQGIVKIAYQQHPYSVVWAIRSDGALIGLTYLRDQNVTAWHRHQLGGNYYGGAPRVLDLCIIPSAAGGYDELWLSVQRTINGQVVTTIEVMTPYQVGVSIDQSWFVDCGLRSDLAQPAATLTPSGLTASSDPDRAPRFTGSGTAKTDTALFSIASVGDIIRCNGGKLRVTGYTDSETVTVQVLEALTNQAPALPGSWSMGGQVTSVAGLDHLEGETVAIVGDGQVLPSAVVTGGAVSLATPTGLVTAGLPYTPAVTTLPWEPQRAAAASANGKLKRINTLYLRFFESAGGQFGIRQADPMTGVEEVKLETIEARQANFPMSQSAPLFTGVRRLPALGGYDREGQLMVVQTLPLPMTVLALSADADVAEIGAP